MFVCDVCEEMDEPDCRLCPLGNPCLDCMDYDKENDVCKSNGACAGSGEEPDQRKEVNNV